MARNVKRALEIATAAVSLAILLGACARPRYARPPVAAPPVYRGEPAATVAPGAGFGDLSWRELIRDEELSKMIEEALARNFDVQIAAARVLEARAQLRISRSALLPSIDALVGYSDLRSPGMDAAFAKSSATSLAVNLGWELDLWGRLRNATVAARSALLGGEEARHIVLQSLVSDVACAYFLLRDLDLETEITRHALKLREESLELVQLRLDNGYSSEIEVRQAEVLVKGARTALTTLELQTEQTENQLSSLLGRNPGPIARGRSLLDPGLTPRLAPGLPSELLARRPDIRQAEQQTIGDQALVAVARAAYFPSISLTAASGFASSALLDLLNPASRVWSLNPLADLPLFHTGAVKAGVRASEARRQQSLLAYQKTVQRAFREVADSLAACRKLSELRTQQEELVESLRHGVELADLAYKGGVASYLEFLDAERQLLDAQLLLAQISRQQLTNVVILYSALGGGWQK